MRSIAVLMCSILASSLMSVALILTNATPVRAIVADIVVGPAGCGDVGYVTDGVADQVQIQAAVDAAVDGDIIELCAGRYEYDGDVDWESDASISLTIRGAGVGETILDGNDDWNIFAVHASSLLLTIQEMTLTNGFGGWGSAILIFDDGDPSSLLVEDVAVLNNDNDDHEGALVVENGSISIVNSYFEGNQAETYGGAAYASDSIAVSGSTFVNNTAGEYGGALYAYSMMISDSTFTENYADDEGGAIFSQGDAEIESSRFIENSARGWAGAISLANDGESGISSISGSVFQGNHSEKGGAVDSWNDRLLLDRNTFTRNYATVYGGAITRSGRTFRSDIASNNRFSLNRSRRGLDVALYYRDGFSRIEAQRDTKNWIRTRANVRVVAW